MARCGCYPLRHFFRRFFSGTWAAGAPRPVANRVLNSVTGSATDLVAVYPRKHPAPAQQYVCIDLCRNCARADRAKSWFDCLLLTRRSGRKRGERSGSPGNCQRRRVGLDLRIVRCLTDAIGAARRENCTNKEFHPRKFRPFPFATDHPGGLPPATTMGSPSARRYSSSPIASTDRSFASSSSISERSPGPGVPCANELWYLIGPGMIATRKAISAGVSSRGSRPK
jgi:hypothetical protein